MTQFFSRANLKVDAEDAGWGWMGPDGDVQWLRLFHPTNRQKYINVHFNYGDGRIRSIIVRDGTVTRRLTGGRRAVQREMGLIK